MDLLIILLVALIAVALLGYSVNIQNITINIGKNVGNGKEKDTGKAE